MRTVKNFHMFIEGRVQGVGYRRFVAVQAQQCGVKGWVRNLLDGRVEVMASYEFAALQEAEREWVKFMETLKRGPTFAKVRDIRIQEVKTETEFIEFSIHPDEETPI